MRTKRLNKERLEEDEGGRGSRGRGVTEETVNARGGETKRNVGKIKSRRKMKKRSRQ